MVIALIEKQEMDVRQSPSWPQDNEKMVFVSQNKKRIILKYIAQKSLGTQQLSLPSRL